jgi:hypothetical protein
MHLQLSALLLSFFFIVACISLTIRQAHAGDCMDDIRYCASFPECMAACDSQQFQRLNITCREWQKNAWDSEQTCVQNSEAKLENCKNVCKYKFHEGGQESPSGDQ